MCQCPFDETPVCGSVNSKLCMYIHTYKNILCFFLYCMILTNTLFLKMNSLGVDGLECSGPSHGVCDCGDCQCFIQEELLASVSEIY